MEEKLNDILRKMNELHKDLEEIEKLSFKEIYDKMLIQEYMHMLERMIVNTTIIIVSERFEEE